MLPRVLPSILKYYNGVTGSKEVLGVRLYTSNNTFFSRFPNSSALRVHYLAPAEIGKELEGAEKMGCNGKSLRRNI